ncbi:unnamed protein product [Arabis nemorensis]|uniref:KIB1-4 beta-propeller domain-containing protein n=1 Tax=Arabis nemorensis TaxID=586526 RepID=A0A565C259_9BRAS|nr:unnamed protein product [Arabis nemorensis]
MASPSPSPSTVGRKRSKILIKEPLNPSFADLTSCLLEVIMSHLVLKDNIRASVACTSWLEAAVSVSNDVFFFNPFSRELISLPKCELPFWEIAFSCPPTLDTCVLFALNRVMTHNVTLSTCRPGATEWITEEFPYDFEDLPSDYDQRYMHSKLVYVNDRFYCYIAGSLYYFHQSLRTWNFHYAYTLPCPYLHYKQQCEFVEKAVFLAEKEGEIFVVFTSGHEKPMVYKLGFFEWEEMSKPELDGLTIFVSFYNSEVRRDLPWMRNNVYFSRFGYNRKYCVSYSFDESKYIPPKVWQNWLQYCPTNSLWIDPPKNVLDYL